MSGSQTYMEIGDQPVATDSQLAVALIPILVPGAGPNGADAVRLATPVQVSSTFLKGTVYGSQTLSNAYPTSIPYLPAIPSVGGMVSLQGQIAAFDTVTGDSAVWNVALVTTRVPNGAQCNTEGDVTPSSFEATGTMATLAASTPPTLSANSQGPVILLTGISANSVVFGYNFTYTQISLA